MDDEVIGRERSEEVAILEDISGAPNAVRGADRRWLLAIAGMAAIVCMGIAGNYAAPAPKERDVAIPKEGQASPPSGTDQLPVAPPRAAIEFLRPVPESVVTKGLIPVELKAAAGSYIYVSMTIGAAVLGWRMVDVDDRGGWSGTLPVFAPQVALPATVRAAGSIEGSPAEADTAITIGAGPPIQVWSARVDRPPDGKSTVRYRAAAPLTLGSVHGWVTDSTGHRLGDTSTEIAVDDWIPGSAGARDFGMGSINGLISLSGRVDDSLTLHISWKDPLTQASGTLERALDPSIAEVP